MHKSWVRVVQRPRIAPKDFIKLEPQPNAKAALFGVLSPSLNLYEGIVHYFVGILCWWFATRRRPTAVPVPGWALATLSLIRNFPNYPSSTPLRLMGTSAHPPVYSFPGMMRGVAVSRSGPPQTPSTTDDPRGVENPVRHQVIRRVSSPSQTILQSPLRHHRRTASVGRPPIRETLNACVTYDEEEDGIQGVRINQYVFTFYRSTSDYPDISVGTL